MPKIALITGATSGIGLATAERLAAEGFDLVLCGRRAERLAQVQAHLSRQVRVHTLRFDVRDRQACQTALATLPPDFAEVDVLINNAGNAHGLDPVTNANLDDWDAMLDGNVKGLLYVSHALIPGMVARQRGQIVNIGSTAAKEVYPNGSVYCASKHAVDALTTGMRMDLYKDNIRVSAVHPGLTATEFSEVRFKGDTDRAATVYQGYQPLTAADVAEAIWFVISRPAHVAVTDLVLTPTAQASSMLVHRQPQA